MLFPFVPVQAQRRVESFVAVVTVVLHFMHVDHVLSKRVLLLKKLSTDWTLEFWIGSIVVRTQVLSQALLRFKVLSALIAHVFFLYYVSDLFWMREFLVHLHG